MLTASQYMALKEKLVTELQRRNACGSVSSYAEKASKGSAVEGNKILASTGNNLIEPILSIKDYGDLMFPVEGEPIPSSFDEELITYVNTLASESMTTTTSSCRGACTGLCMNGCASSCSGCKGSCSGCNGCNGTCGTGCASGSRN